MAFQTGFARRFGLIDDAGSIAAARAELVALGVDIDPRTLVGALAQAEKTIVALARALRGEARVIVLDEVTASLPTPDAARIHATVRTVRDRGVGFVYVSHRMEEVFDLCDHLTVFADGRDRGDDARPSGGLDRRQGRGSRPRRPARQPRRGEPRRPRTGRGRGRPPRHPRSARG